MSNKRDYYDVLGVGRNATSDDVKKAFRNLAKQYHPDAGSTDKTAEEKFKEAAEAYEILSNPEKRSMYDKFGHAGVSAEGMRGSNGFGGFSDIFEDFFNFDIFGSRSGRSSASAERGHDLRYDITIPFMEAVKGIEKEIRIPKIDVCHKCAGHGAKSESGKKTCPSCNGRGEISRSQGFFNLITTCPKCQGQGTIITDLCPECKGAGRVKTEKNVSVKIPAGVDTGYALRIKGEGGPGQRGGFSGDLHIVIEVEEHEIFKRHNNDVIIQVPVTLAQAILGAEIEVPTIDGESKVKIPEGTQSGTILRLKNKGIPDANGHGRGDQHIRVVIEIPTKLSHQQKQLIKEFEQPGNDKIYPAIKDFAEKVKKLFGN